MNLENTEKGSKSTNHRSQTITFWTCLNELSCFLRVPLRWLTAPKNANVSWLLNFRVRVFLKSAVKSKFSFILFVYNLIRCSQKKRESYPAKCFPFFSWVKDERRVSPNRSSNNQAQDLIYEAYTNSGTMQSIFIIFVLIAISQEDVRKRNASSTDDWRLGKPILCSTY